MTDRTLSRPETPEDSSWDALRERVSITVRPIGAPTPIGLFGQVKEIATESGVPTKL